MTKLKTLPSVDGGPTRRIWRHAAQRAATCCVVWAAVIALWTSAADAVQVIHVPGDIANLQTALNTISHGGIIELSPGTYAAPSGGFMLGNGAKHFTVRGAGATPVTLDGQSARPVFLLLDSTTSVGTFVTFENLRFANGLSTVDGTGGGVTVSRASASFVGCVFDNNVSSAPVTGGGGVFAWGGATVHFIDCEWLGNSAANEGGGLRVGDSKAVVTGCVFDGNRTNRPGHRSTSAGGGIHQTDSTVYVADSNFRNNQAGYVGGALYALGSWVDSQGTIQATMVVANSTVADNIAVPDPGVTTPSPPEGGGLNAEDAAQVKVYFSRFDRNSAGNGGGLNLYRAQAEVYDSVFRGNRATQVGAGTGFGGAISATSADTVFDGAENRPSASIVVRRSLLQGRFESVGTTAQIGGCMFVSGDGNRRFGQGGVTPTADSASTRATATVTDSALFDCDTLESVGIGGTGIGGGLEVGLTTLTIAQSIVANCDAVGPNTSGGAARATFDSLVSISDSTLVANSAGWLGGAVLIDGSRLDVGESSLIENQIDSTPGAALFATIYPPEDFDATGVISGSIISNTASNGTLIHDSDSMDGPINDLRYDGNTIFDTSPGQSIYTHHWLGSKTVATLNTLVVNRNGMTPSTDKSQVDNIDPAAAPVTGDLVAAPSKVLPRGAADDPAGATSAYLVYGRSGAAATLDGAPVASFAGLSTASTGTHVLSVGGQDYQAAVASGPAPSLSWSADPAVISGGQSTTLQWATTAGTFVNITADHGLVLPSTASGSIVISPTVTTTYRAILTAQEGGDVAQVTVYVDELPADEIFADGFEGGSTSGWSSAVGG